MRQAVLACAAAVVLSIGHSHAATAQTTPPGQSASYIATADGPGRFPLEVKGEAAPLSVSSGDYPGVIRAAHDLGDDIGRVTSHAPRIVQGDVPRSPDVVLVGTLGRSPQIDALVRQGRLDVSAVRGRWETWLVQVVNRPMAGVDRALVITGSDQRGTIYGIYDVSAQIGVSPWYWWADVPVVKHASLFVLPGPHSQGEPAVKYRGIFINDEAPALSGWAREKFGGFNHEFYARVFELLLRLKGNYLWPAMWGSAFAVDDTLNPVVAKEYGVVMGTSHHEPMTRAQAEWHRFGSGPWNYETNDSTLRAFWRAGIQRMDARENIVTIGMRGDGDMPMTQGSNIALLERVVADQRKILQEVTGKDPSQIPQLWALYKEVQDYYDKGMRVPDDVTLLFSDDNWGNIRRLPSPADRNRRGGFGIYYHFDYVGGPRNYKWINTNPLARVQEQMHLAYAYGATRIWIVNVGDIKPLELPTQFFLDYAWNPNAIPADRVPAYTRQWAAQQFGTAHAEEIAHILTEYTKFNGRRKPELLDTATYSLTHYREAESVAAAYDSLAEEAKRLDVRLPPAARDAYFELVLHPVEASATLNDLYVTVAKNRLYARQLRASTNVLADSARKLFGRDAELSREYNRVVAGGKWDHMMDQTHIGYTYWQEPPRDVMPRVDVIHVPAVADMGVMVEGQDPPRFGGPLPIARREPTLPEFDPYLRQSRYIAIFDRGSVPFAYTVHAGAPWLVVAPDHGTVRSEERLVVSVDWSRAPRDSARAPITIEGPDGRSVVVQAVMRNPAFPARDSVRGFVESDGYVSMEAEHYSRAVGSRGMHWERLPDLGRTLSGMEAAPVTASSEAPAGDSPRLEYEAFLFDSGTVTVDAYLSPTLDFTGSKHGLRFAVSFDDAPPQLLDMTADTTTHTWERHVADEIEIVPSRHTIAHPGEHVLKFWFVDPGVVLQKLVVDAGGVKPSYLGPPESYHRGVSSLAASTSDAMQR